MGLHDAFDVSTPAIVLAEGEFGRPGGKTANGVVMHSELFETRAVIDSTAAGQNAREVLEKADVPTTPVVDSLKAALEVEPDPAVLVVGVAPVGGELPESWVTTIEDAIRAGCDVVSGMHVFLGDDPEWQALANDRDVDIYDVRKPPDEDDLRVGDGRVDDVDAEVVLVMGTDCAVGKRTTTFELYRTAVDAGVDAGWVATGQTGIMVGAHSGVVIDRVPADFTAGIVEDLVCAVAADHDLVFVEGQASLTHRAYSSVTLAILHGAWPDAVVLADDPDRTARTHFEDFAVEGISRERDLIESVSDARVAAVSTWGDPEDVTSAHDLPASNVFDEGGTEALFDAVTESLRVEVSQR